MSHLLEFCNSESQRTKVKLYDELGSSTKVATVLGITHQNVTKTLRALKKRAAAQGIAPEADMSHLAAQGFNVKGVSTLYDEDGQVQGSMG